MHGSCLLGFVPPSQCQGHRKGSSGVCKCSSPGGLPDWQSVLDIAWLNLWLSMPQLLLPGRGNALSLISSEPEPDELATGLDAQDLQ